MTSEETEQEHFEAVIIGAGMAGLAAGIRLAIAGKKVIDGINPSEVKMQNLYTRRQGLFEKMFNFFD